MIKKKPLFMIITTLLISNSAFSRNVHFSNADLETQYQRSISFLMQNLSRSDSAPGSIVAAPSHHQPDYYFHWVRDAALTTSSLMSLYSHSDPSFRSALKNFFVDHVGFNLYMQQNLTSLSGLGEPKFNMNGSVYSGPWGRPQNDGPALRSLGMIQLLSLMNKETWPEAAQLSEKLYDKSLSSKSLIKSDLEYTAHHWPDLSFDLWEEVNGLHFYTLLAQRKALEDGESIARAYSDYAAADFYNSEKNKLNQQLESFWNPDQGFILATLYPQFSLSGRMNGKKRLLQFRTRLDIAIILAVLHSSTNSESFSINDSRVLATYEKLRTTFAQIYSINKNQSLGTAFGRYPEDTYNGYETNSQGNPWVLSTMGAAEFLYRLIEKLQIDQIVLFNKTNLSFYQYFLNANTKVFAGRSVTGRSPQFNKLLQNLSNEADSMIDRVLYHKNSDGSLSEQFNRENGYMQGAPNLTWSHASFITAKLARDRVQSLLISNKKNKINK